MSSEEKASRKKMVSYSMGWFIDNLVIASYGVLIFYYYEVEIGLATALVGISFVIYAIWNMVNDPLVGFLTDKPMRWSKKWGLRKPWIILGGLLTALTYLLLYTPPDVDVQANPWPVFWYMVIITCLFDTFYSIFTTHYIGGFTNIFRSQEERRKGGTLAYWAGSLARFFGLGIIVPIIVIAGDPSSYIRASLVTAIAIIICMVFFLPGIKETEAVKMRYLKIYEHLEKTQLPYFKFLKIAFKQKNFKLQLISFCLFTFAYSLQQASLFFFIRDVLGADIIILTLYSLVFVFGFLGSIFIWSRFVADRIGHPNLYALGFILIGIAFLSSMWVTTVIEFYFWNFIGGIAFGAIGCVAMSIAADANDEVTEACGRHQEAALIGIRNFFYRFAFVLVGIILAGTHILTGYVPGATTQTEFAQLGVRIHAGLFSAIFCFVGALLVLKYYDLKGDKREQLMTSLREKGL